MKSKYQKKNNKYLKKNNKTLKKNYSKKNKRCKLKKRKQKGGKKSQKSKKHIVKGGSLTKPHVKYDIDTLVDFFLQKIIEIENLFLCIQGNLGDEKPQYILNEYRTDILEILSFGSLRCDLLEYIRLSINLFPVSSGTRAIKQSIMDQIGSESDICVQQIVNKQAVTSVNDFSYFCFFSAETDYIQTRDIKQPFIIFEKEDEKYNNLFGVLQYKSTLDEDVQTINIDVFYALSRFPKIGIGIKLLDNFCIFLSEKYNRKFKNIRLSATSDSIDAWIKIVKRLVKNLNRYCPQDFHIILQYPNAMDPSHRMTREQYDNLTEINKSPFVTVDNLENMNPEILGRLVNK